jgi:hypothetical protein
MARQSSTKGRANGERNGHTATPLIVQRSSAVSKANTIPHHKQCKRPDLGNAPLLMILVMQAVTVRSTSETL